MNKRILLIGLLWDLVLPAVAYYVLRAFGVEAMTALAVGGLAALARVGWVAVIRRRLDGLAALVTASFALLLVVSLLTGDPRALLARESVLSGAAGILLTASCLIRRPVLYAAVRRVNASQAELLARWDERWRTQPAFRRHFFVLSAVIGAVLLAESALRLVLVYTLPVDTVAGLSTGLHVATLDPRHDLDLASYGAVRLEPDLTWKPKAVFHEIAAAYGDWTAGLPPLTASAARGAIAV